MNLAHHPVDDPGTTCMHVMDKHVLSIEKPTVRESIPPFKRELIINIGSG
mgnify:FL=1